MIKSKETSERFKIDKHVINLVLNTDMYQYPGKVDVIYTSLSPEDLIHKAYIVEGIIEKLGSWDKSIYDIEGVGDVNIETERDKIQNRAQEDITVKRKRKDERLKSQTTRRIKLVFNKAPNAELLSRTATKDEIDRDIEVSLADDERPYKRPDTRELTQAEFDKDLFDAYAEDDAILSELSQEKLNDERPRFRNHGGKKHTRRRRRSKQFK